MADSKRYKLFVNLTKAYSEAHKKKSGYDAQQEVSAKWKEMKKLKDADLEIAVDTEILKLKKISTKNKV